MIRETYQNHPSMKLFPPMNQESRIAIAALAVGVVSSILGLCAALKANFEIRKLDRDTRRLHDDLKWHIEKLLRMRGLLSAADQEAVRLKMAAIDEMADAFFETGGGHLTPEKSRIFAKAIFDVMDDFEKISQAAKSYRKRTRRTDDQG